MQTETSPTPYHNQIIIVLGHPGQKWWGWKTLIMTLIPLCFILTELVHVMAFNCVFPVCFHVLLASEVGVKFIFLGLSPRLHVVSYNSAWTLQCGKPSCHSFVKPNVISPLLQALSFTSWVTGFPPEDSCLLPVVRTPSLRQLLFKSLESHFLPVSRLSALQLTNCGWHSSSHTWALTAFSSPIPLLMLCFSTTAKGWRVEWITFLSS